MMPEAVLKTWSHWSGREDLSDEFKRLLSSASEGEADLVELLAAARRIDIADEDSWYRELMRLADDAGVVAEAALVRGGTATANRKWRRAIDCYEAAAFPFDSSDQRQQAVIARMRACARAFMRYGDPLGEVVTIPWRADYPLEGYFLPARVAGRAPTVICIVEPGRRKEACLFKLAGHASERGLSLLVVDLFGPGAGDRFEDIAGSRQLETAIGSVMDYAAARDDVDESRVVILADEWGSSFVARGIGQDRRCAAAVCDGGLWDMHERAFLAQRFAARNSAMASTMGASRLAHRMPCPVLIAMPAQGWLPAEQATRLVAEMKRDRQDITLKMFPGEQGNTRGSALANQFIFDWIAAQLGSARQRTGKTIKLKSLRH
jgi:dienelactone hydrolase